MTRWRNYSLFTKLTLILLLILAGFLAVSLYGQYRQQQAFVFAEAIDKARIITAEATRTREYVSQQLQAGQVELTRERYGLIPVVAANRIGRLVARDLDYTIRHTSIRTRNRDNAPDAYERAALQRLAASREVPFIAEVTTLDGSRVFRYLRAAVVDESCLACHGEPASSPAFLREIYPPDRDPSYHYRLGEVIGAVSIVIPMTQLDQQVAARFRGTLLTSAGFFLAMVICIGLLLRKGVIRPLAELAASIDAIRRTGHFAGRLPVRSTDEIGRLVTGFNAMAGELEGKTAQLEESEKRFRLLVEMARDAIVAFLPNGQIFLFNRQAEQIFGYRQGELLGEPIARLLPPGCEFDGQQLLDFLPRASAGWFNEVHPLTGLRRDQTQVKLEMTVNIVDTGDRPFYTAMLRETGSVS
jgi:PAS domain S-box-containing protein